MMKLVDCLSSMSCDIDSLIDENCFLTLWIVGLIWLRMMELRWYVWFLNYTYM